MENKTKRTLSFSLSYEDITDTYEISFTGPFTDRETKFILKVIERVSEGRTVGRIPNYVDSPLREFLLHDELGFATTKGTLKP